MRFIVFLVVLGGFLYGDCWDDGQDYERKKEYKKALESYLAGADRGVVICMIEASKILSDKEYKLQTDPEKAKELLEKALEKRPYHSVVHYNLGSYYYNKNTKENDKKARYHFLFAYYLWELDAKEFIKTLPKVEGFEESVLENSEFKILEVANRIVYFSRKKFSIESTSKEKILLKMSSTMEISIFKDRVVLDAILNPMNALKFGEVIRLVQAALYIDIPTEIEKKSDKGLDKLIGQTLSKKNNTSTNFYDTFNHTMEFNNESRLFRYFISVKR